MAGLWSNADDWVISFPATTTIVLDDRTGSLAHAPAGTAIPHHVFAALEDDAGRKNVLVVELSGTAE